MGVALHANNSHMKNTFYPDFKYPVADLSAYSLAIGVFVISLKSDEIIQFKPKDAISFKMWLEKYNVRNVDEEEC
ncbi:Nitrate/nitrite response regulator protein NarL (fragment) [Sphingobacterium sp. PM2-P1-29]